MDEEDDFRADDPINLLGKEDLDPLSLAELDSRVALLKAEIVRTEAHKAGKSSHLSAADALFKK
ncbi:DUF1192 domain-containing protein [Sphingomicrobium nitratireducens]|uniref:DUF1192 domain-containing protein n=1 Tax=Sphingomicrobium nitratireducens TaxID=2964666 RepID=UPI002240AAB7|nr:DUF1192 domain-containing protein [Sphingomicrobium nitratireducens]